MKYINMMAGAFGLMALAACSNNEEIVVEQPQVARTLTVTLGNGADTRLTFSEFDANEGIKGSWESTDEIGVQFSSISDPLIYKADGEGPTTTFTLKGETGPQENAPYRVVYPVNYAYGYDFSIQSGLHADLKNWAYASAEDVRFKNNQSENKITLTPLCSFIRIPAGTEFPGLSVGSSGAFIEVEGDNLRSKVNSDGDTEDSILIDVDGSMFDKATTKEDLYIALPVQIGKEEGTYQAITNLLFTIETYTSEHHYTYYSIVKGESADSPVEITEPGKVYVLAKENLLLLEP